MVGVWYTTRERLHLADFSAPKLKVSVETQIATYIRTQKPQRTDT